ncbi:MAG: hypothetical protein R3F56_12555 [Planctomycetota bacterium]
MYSKVCLVSLGLAATAAAQSAVTITDGNATFSYTSYATATNSTAGFANFAANTTDHCYQSWWYYAVSGDANGSALNNSGSQLVVTPAANGRSVDLDWANVDGRSFAANLKNTVYSTGPTTGVSTQALKITNNTGAALSITIYNYTDLDIAGSTGDQSMQEPTWPAGNMVVQDTTTFNNVWVLGDGIGAAEAGGFATIRGLVLGAQPYVPSGNVAFGPGDFTGVLSWTATIPAGGDATFRSMLAIDQIPASQRQADAATYCTAKPGTNGLPAWTLNRPYLGSNATLEITNGLNGSAPIVFLGVAPTNIPFPPFGTVCTLPVTTLGMPAFASGISALPIPVPNSSALGGATIDLQGLFVDPGAAGNLAHTDGMAWTFGSF